MEATPGIAAPHRGLRFNGCAGAYQRRARSSSICSDRDHDPCIRLKKITFVHKGRETGRTSLTVRGDGIIAARCLLYKESL